MSWYKNTKRVDLGKIGYPDLFVEFKAINSMTYKQAIQFQEKINTAQKAVEENPEDPEAGMGITKSLLADLVVSWNIPPLDKEIGEGVLPLPKEDPGILEDIPSEIISFIADAVQGDVEAVPNGSGS